jgi:hypothetical protein
LVTELRCQGSRLRPDPADHCLSGETLRFWLRNPDQSRGRSGIVIKKILS